MFRQAQDEMDKFPCEFHPFGVVLKSIDVCMRFIRNVLQKIKCVKITLGILFFVFLISWIPGYSITFSQDTVRTKEQDNEVFYDSLKTRAYRHGITKFMYQNIMHGNEEQEGLIPQYISLEENRGKTISSIKFQSLAVFGPTVQDTVRVPATRLGEFGNRLHTKTNQHIIEKNVLLEEGDTLDVEKVLDNERIIRSLPFIKDVRILVSKNENDSNLVDLTVLTKDVFSFGIGGHFDGIKAANLEMYNQNIWGIGHQISAKIVGNADKEPYVGFEGSYSISNIGGNFVDMTLGYANTYKREGVMFDFEKEFLRSTTRWGGGLSAYRLTRSDYLIDYDHLKTDFPLNYKAADIWSGYAFLLNKDQPENNIQLVVSGRFRDLKFFDRPAPGPDNNQYYSDSKLFLASISLSKRNYIRDYLVYSYGITEDIPKGFLHEWVFGFDNNEFINRWYSHLYFSSGNLVRYRPSYLFASVGIGSFFNARHLEQGQFELNSSYISRLFPIGIQQARQFIDLKYMIGIKRFDAEKIYLRNDHGIRGLNTEQASGKQRLSLNLETVVFQKRAVLDFNIAFFAFADMGFVGSEKKMILTQEYYSGVGAGIRLRNENLVFRTLQIRLAFYPYSPSDAGNIGFEFTEMNKNNFYNFQPRRPEPLRFE